MRQGHRRHRWILVLTLGVGILTAGRAGIADDTALFTNQVAPNVLLVVDNSGSMNSMVWHPRFVEDVVYDPATCPYIADENDPDYDPRCLKYPLCELTSDDFEGNGDIWSSLGYESQNGRNVNLCDNSRRVFTDDAVRAVGRKSIWTKTYLEWYMSDNVEEDPDVRHRPRRASKAAKPAGPRVA